MSSIKSALPLLIGAGISFDAKGPLSEIGGNQIVRTPASADIDPGRGSAYQITVRIEYFQKARLIGAGIRFNPPQCSFVDEE
jgi:hypothetical protein